MNIIYEDRYLIAVNKKAGELSQSDGSASVSCMQQLEKKCTQKLHIINRIDRPVSGIMLVAKNKNSSTVLSELIRNGEIDKVYLAAVSNKPSPSEATLTNYITKKGSKAYISNNPKEGKKSSLNYSLISHSESYFFLIIRLETGRFHQIRAQLSYINSPVKGDVKYGARRSNKDRSIHLHAFELSFTHPFTNQNLKLRADLPKDPVWEALGLTKF